MFFSDKLVQMCTKKCVLRMWHHDFLCIISRDDIDCMSLLILMANVVNFVLKCWFVVVILLLKNMGCPWINYSSNSMLAKCFLHAIYFGPLAAILRASSAVIARCTPPRADARAPVQNSLSTGCKFLFMFGLHGTVHQTHDLRFA